MPMQYVYQNFMQILEGAANHMQHHLNCFSLVSAPIKMVLQSLQHHKNGATNIKKQFAPPTICLIGAANWHINLIGARYSEAPFVKCQRLHRTTCTAPLLEYSSFNWCCKHLLHLLILAENFKILGLTGGKTFLGDSKMGSL